MGNISERTKNEFSDLLELAIKETLVSADKSVTWKLKPIRSIERIKEKESFLLTISFFTFRVVVALHFSYSKVLDDYVINETRTNKSSQEKNAVYDYLGELGNILCGVIKRELTKEFSYSGMSTPNLLSRDCINQLEDLGFSYDTHILGTFNDDLTIAGSLFVHPYKDTEFSLTKDANNHLDSKSGELELF